MVLAVVIGICLVSLNFVSQFSFDASEDALVAEGDLDIAYYREISKTFGGDDFLFLTYTPYNQSIFAEDTLGKIELLSAKLETIDGVRSVTSILDAPLLRNPPVPLTELAAGIKTLRSADVDLRLAEQELTTSPLFSELLISLDGASTAMRIDLEDNFELSSLKDELDEFRALDSPSNEESAHLATLEESFRNQYASNLESKNATLVEVRRVRDELGEDVTAYLGGVPLVTSDMIEFVKTDIVVFGFAVLGLIAIMLFILFRRPRFVVIPLVSTAVTIFLTISVLGFLRQPTTVISSNFVSLLAIITISFSIHLITKYRELRAKSPDSTHTSLVYSTMTDKLVPCIYTAITTMVAFGSLMTSDIVPVADFGKIMCIGVVISFLVTYSLFAGLLLLLPKGVAATTLNHEPWLTKFLAMLAVKKTAFVIGMTALSFVIAAIGVTRLSLDNRFIDYFKSSTEIHQGMAYIDEHIGGTIPLDVILHFPPFVPTVVDTDSDFYSEDTDAYPQRYWYTSDKIDYVSKLHTYLDQKPEIGKVISLGTLEQIGRSFNNGEPLGSVELVAAIGSVPEDIRHDIIDPYASPEAGLLKISTRLHETGPVFSHNELIEDIYAFAEEELGLSREQVRVTGMAVLFNGMLENLFDSQRSTILFVVAATGLLFIILLRSLTLAVLGLIPNILAALTIMAFMGFSGIPLDMMTITIAAIIIGIGVDDAIHYLHRFKDEFAKSGDVKQAVNVSHASIGDAIYYTSFTVVIGYSVLAFSNFIPTVYFGILAAIAMGLALIANLTVLPALLVMVYQNKNLGNEQNLETSS